MGYHIAMLEQLKDAICAELLNRLPGWGEIEMNTKGQFIYADRDNKYWKGATIQQVASLMLDDLITQSAPVPPQASVSDAASQMGKVSSPAQKASALRNLEKAQLSGKRGWPKGKPRKSTEPPYTVIGHYEDSTRQK